MMLHNILIVSDSEDEQDRECFAFTISTTSMEGLSLEPSQSTLCISDGDGRTIPYMYIVAL